MIHSLILSFTTIIIIVRLCVIIGLFVCICAGELRRSDNVCLAYHITDISEKCVSYGYRHN
jgi:hypothetical protein